MVELVPLWDALKGHFDKKRADLPKELEGRMRRERGLELHSIWDSLTPDERRAAAAEKQGLHTKDEDADDKFLIGFWESCLNASKWWQVESVSPVDAALLLSGHKPGRNNRIAPDDFVIDGMLPLFIAATPGRRTLKDWANFAKISSQKIHPWSSKWERAKLRHDPNFFAESVYGKTKADADPVSATPEQAVSQPPRAGSNPEPETLDRPVMKKKAILETGLGRIYPYLESAFRRPEQWVKDCSAGGGKYYLDTLEKGCIELWGYGNKDTFINTLYTPPFVRGMKDGKPF